MNPGRRTSGWLRTDVGFSTPALTGYRLAGVMLTGFVLTGGMMASAGCSGSGEAPSPSPEAPSATPTAPPSVTSTMTPQETPSPTPSPDGPSSTPQLTPTPEPPPESSCGSWYPDLDGDGFGSGDVGACEGDEQSVQNNLDCDDDSPYTYPGAPDEAGDGVDSSCDGMDGLAPSVGLDTSHFTSIQAAMDAAPPGATVWIGPGTYHEWELTFRGKAIAVRATEGEAETIVDAEGQGTVFQFDREESDASLLEGFTLQNGVASELCSLTNYGLCWEYAGGIFMDNASPTLVNVTVADSSSEANGAAGGIYLGNSNPILEHITVRGNRATGDDSAGGLYFLYSNPILTDVHLEDNGSGNAPDSLCVAGGMYLNNANPTITNLTLRHNQCSGGSGGISMWASSPVVRGLTVAGNIGQFVGGLTLTYSSPHLEQVLISGNRGLVAGGVEAYGSDPTFEHASIVGNLAAGRDDSAAGGVMLNSSNTRFHNSVLAFNWPMNLLVQDDSTPSSAPDLSYVNLFAPFGANHNLPQLNETVLTLNPGFVTFSDDDDPSNDDLHLSPASPLRDAGDPNDCPSGEEAGCDPDGSTPDLGGYGGRGADFSYYLDADHDGYYDGWELSRAPDLTTLNGQADPEGDGLQNSEELYAGTDPQAPDTDGDGASDGDELAAERDPLNAFSVPGGEGLVTLPVPSDAYPTLLSALNAIPSGSAGAIQVAAGTFPERLVVERKQVSITGAGQDRTFVDGQAQGRGITLLGATLVLSHLTVQNGQDTTGGGLYMTASTGSLVDVTLENNAATAGGGGGMALSYSNPQLQRVLVTNNRAPYGAGISLNRSGPDFSHVTISGNQLTDGYSGDGGGVYGYGSYPHFSHTTVTGNRSTRGAGLWLSMCQATLDYSVVTGNVSTSVVGGVYVSSTRLTVNHGIIAFNAASQSPNVLGSGTTSQPSELVFNYTDIFSPPVFGTDTYAPGGTNLMVEPQFLRYHDAKTGQSCVAGVSLTCLPSELHLALHSPLAHAGDPSQSDADGTRASLGIYGGDAGDAWDRDEDGLHDYFWPGEWSDVPQGVTAANYDCNDFDGSQGACP